MINDALANLLTLTGQGQVAMQTPEGRPTVAAEAVQRLMPTPPSVPQIGQQAGTGAAIQGQQLKDAQQQVMEQAMQAQRAQNSQGIAGLPAQNMQRGFNSGGAVGYATPSTSAQAYEEMRRRLEQSQAKEADNDAVAERVRNAQALEASLMRAQGISTPQERMAQYAQDVQRQQQEQEAMTRARMQQLQADAKRNELSNFMLGVSGRGLGGILNGVRAGMQSADNSRNALQNYESQLMAARAANIERQNQMLAERQGEVTGRLNTASTAARQEEMDAAANRAEIAKTFGNQARGIEAIEAARESGRQQRMSQRVSPADQVALRMVAEKDPVKYLELKALLQDIVGGGIPAQKADIAADKVILDNFSKLTAQEKIELQKQGIVTPQQYLTYMRGKGGEGASASPAGKVNSSGFTIRNEGPTGT